MNWKEEVQKRKEDLLADLVELLKIPSVKDLSTATEQAPFGREIRKSLDWILDKATNDGFRTKNINNLVGYAEIGPKEAEDYISVLCHLDVVPATGQWDSHPFTPEIRNGRLFARGAIDDKGPTMAAYYALKILIENGLSLKHRVRIIFGTDEESGMRCMRNYIQEEPQPLTGFAPDAEFPIIHAEKGQINAILKWKQIDTGHLISFTAGEKGNMVPDQATAVLSSAPEEIVDAFQGFAISEGLEYSIEKNNDSIVLLLKGKSAHGAEPFKGINAGTKLAKFLIKYVENNYLHFVANCLDDDFYGKKLNLAFEDAITGPLTVNTGIIRLKKGKEASIALNIRCPVKTPYLRTIEKLGETVQSYGFELEEIREKKPHYVDPSEPVIQILRKAYEEETGQPATLLSTGGATYARFIKNGVAFGALFPGREYTAHQRNEYIDLEDLFQATAIYANAIYHLANY